MKKILTVFVIIVALMYLAFFVEHLVSEKWYFIPTLMTMLAIELYHLLVLFKLVLEELTQKQGVKNYEE